MVNSLIAEHYADQIEYATFIQEKCSEHPDLIDQIKLKTPKHIINEICAENYEHIDETIEASLSYDVSKIMGAKLWKFSFQN